MVLLRTSESTQGELSKFLRFEAGISSLGWPRLGFVTGENLGAIARRWLPTDEIVTPQAPVRPSAAALADLPYPQHTPPDPARRSRCLLRRHRSWSLMPTIGNQTIAGSFHTRWRRIEARRQVALAGAACAQSPPARHRRWASRQARWYGSWNRSPILWCQTKTVMLMSWDEKTSVSRMTSSASSIRPSSTAGRSRRATLGSHRLALRSGQAEPQRWANSEARGSRWSRPACSAMAILSCSAPSPVRLFDQPRLLW